MVRRILSALGIGWYVPTLPSSGDATYSTPDTDGRTTVTFAPGARVPLSEGEAEAQREADRQRITDNDLVWPGKVETFYIRNTELAPFRFSLTLTDLEGWYYQRRPAQGGKWQPDGSVILEPDEETSIEVVFQQPTDPRAHSRTFHIVVTRFDARLQYDQGEIMSDVPLRWVSLPKEGDLKLAAQPPEVWTRPWRRTALLALQFQNKSLLPSSIHLDILRAPTRDKLQTEGEPTGTLSQSVESRTPGVWHCLLPAQRASYFATVQGKARVADQLDVPLALAKPVFVRYIPWLRLPKDWAFLFCVLFFLLWLFYGIPLPRKPGVTLTVNISLPPGGKPDDLVLTVTPKEGNALGQPIPVSAGTGDARHITYAFDLPSRWAGYRWPFGWNAEPIKFDAKLEPTEKKIDLYKRYDLGAIPTGKPTSPRTFVLPVNTFGMFQSWNLKASSGHLGAEGSSPSLTTLSPPGPYLPGATLTIKGLSLGKAGTVKFDGKTAPTEPRWGDQQIQVQIPSTAQPNSTVELSILPEGEKDPLTRSLTITEKKVALLNERSGSGAGAEAGKFARIQFRPKQGEDRNFRPNPSLLITSVVKVADVQLNHEALEVSKSLAGMKRGGEKWLFVPSRLVSDELKKMLNPPDSDVTVYVKMLEPDVPDPNPPAPTP